MNKIVYKYRIWENLNHRRFVTNNEIFFASPKSLNDPLELTNIIRYDLLNYDDKIKFISQIIKRKEKFSQDEQIFIKAKKIIEEDKINDYKRLKKYAHRLTHSFRKRVGVFSTSNSSDNNHLWLNYAFDYKGFCIGYDNESLISFLKIKLQGGFGGNVDYFDQLPTIIPDLNKKTHNLIEICKTKLRKWELEDEDRILKFNYANKKCSIKSSIIKEIIIGEDMSEKSKIELLKFVKRKYNCKIFIAYRPNGKTDLKAKLQEIKI